MEYSDICALFISMSETGTDINKCVSLLKEGKLVAIPTETVYGLAANAFDENAVVSIYEAKNRPFFDPLIIHTNSVKKVKTFVREFPAKAQRLADVFWPGPLTLLLPRASQVPDLVTSGLDNVAIRIPDHELTLQVLAQLDFPLAAPSANPFGYVSPTTAEHVEKQLGEKIPYILNGGECKVGIESTIIGFDGEQAVVYRLGGLSVEDIEKVAGKVRLELNQSSDPKAPGQLKTHYAPRKPLYIGNIEELMKEFRGKKTGVISFTRKYKTDHSLVLSPEGNLKEAAQKLFSAMRGMDESDVEIILAEEFPDSFLGRAINDRLKRASVQ